MAGDADLGEIGSEFIVDIARDSRALSLQGMFLLQPADPRPNPAQLDRSHGPSHREKSAYERANAKKSGLPPSGLDAKRNRTHLGSPRPCSHGRRYFKPVVTRRQVGK